MAQPKKTLGDRIKALQAKEAGQKARLERQKQIATHQAAIKSLRSKAKVK